MINLIKYSIMKGKLFLAILFMFCCFVNGWSQDAAFYYRYAVKGDKEAMCNLANCYFNGNGGAEQDYQAAFLWYEKSAKKGYAPAQFMTAICYLYGGGVNANWAMAMKWADKALKKHFYTAYYIKAQVYKDGYLPDVNNRYIFYLEKAAMSGYAVAQEELGELYLNGSEQYSIEQNMTKAFELFKQAAENGNIEAQCQLGNCYYFGNGILEDKEKAYEYYRLSAENGNDIAQCMLGRGYLYGDIGTIDYKMAFDWYMAAAAQGSSFAYGRLGDMYYNGFGLDINYNSAIDYYKKAAEGGDVASMNQLGYMYYAGQGASVDYSMSFKYYKQAADLGDAIGLCYLGFCYREGIGVPVDMEKAFEYYLSSAEAGYTVAQGEVAMMYSNGSGVAKNESKYKEWMTKAAENGNSLAMLHLAFFYLNNNNDEALMWLILASNAGDATAQAALGGFYYEGNPPVENKDFSQAFSLMSKAVQNPDWESVADGIKATIYRYLGNCYRYGRGTSPDQSLASYYTEEAAKYGDQDAQNISNFVKMSNMNNDSVDYTGTVNADRIVPVKDAVIETEFHVWRITSIELSNNCTILYEIVTPKEEGTYVYSEGTEFIEDAVTGEQYHAVDATLGTKNDPTILYTTAPFQFNTTFPALPASVSHINIWSGTQYYIKNLKIR